MIIKIFDNKNKPSLAYSEVVSELLYKATIFLKYLFNP